MLLSLLLHSIYYTQRVRDSTKGENANKIIKYKNKLITSFFTKNWNVCNNINWWNITTQNCQSEVRKIRLGCLIQCENFNFVIFCNYLSHLFCITHLCFFVAGSSLRMNLTHCLTPLFNSLASIAIVCVKMKYKFYYSIFLKVCM